MTDGKNYAVGFNVNFFTVPVFILDSVNNAVDNDNIGQLAGEKYVAAEVFDFLANIFNNLNELVSSYMRTP